MILIEILILVITLMILVIVSSILHKINKEKFENCVGVQYNGLHFLENKKAPLFTRGYKSKYADGGLLIYDQDQAAIDYDKGLFTPAV